MGCYNCICEKRDNNDERISFCQLSTLRTFDNNEEDNGYVGECKFYNSSRKDFIDCVLKVDNHKGDDFNFSILEVVDYDMHHDDEYEYCSAYSKLISKKDLHIKDFWELLKRQKFWEKDKNFFEEVKNEKIEYIEFYGDNEIGLQLNCYDVIDEIEITEDDNNKFELLQMLYFRTDEAKLKDILLCME